jgi:hypothetical protein
MKETDKQNTNYPLIASIEGLTSIENTDTLIARGRLLKTDTTENGKVNMSRFFDYEMIFDDNTGIPVLKEVKIDEKYIGKLIEITCIVRFQPVHQKPCPPFCQNTTPFYQIIQILNFKIKF